MESSEKVKKLKDLKATEIGKYLYDQLDKLIFGHKELKKFYPIAFLAREHIFIVGPPGTAKTLSSEMEAQMLDLSFYHFQATKDTRMSDIIGPSIIKREKEIIAQGVGTGTENETIYESFIPDCLLTHQVVFIDEGPRLNKEILKSLLGIMNEKRYRYYNIEKKCWEWYQSVLQTLTFAGNPNDRSSEVLEDAMLDRFSLGIYCRNLLFKGKINELRDAMYYSRTWPENLLSRLPEEKISSESLDEAYRFVDGDKKIPIPFIMVWALSTLLDTIISVLGLKEEDALITDRATIKKMYKLIRAHALFEGRTEVSWDDFRFMYGYITHRVEKKHLKSINKIVELFIDLMHHHEHMKYFKGVAERADDSRRTIDHNLSVSPEIIREYEKDMLELTQFFDHIKNLFMAAKQTIETASSYKDIMDAESNKPLEKHFKDQKNEDKQKTLDSVRENSGTKKDHGTEQAKPSSEKKSDNDPMHIDKDLFSNAQSEERLNTSQSNDAGPDTDIVIHGLKNFDPAEGTHIFFEEIENIIRKLGLHVETEDKQGKPTYRRDIYDIQEIMEAEPTNVGKYLDTGSPRPQKEIKTSPLVDIIPLRDVSYSMAGQKTEKTLTQSGNLARWASQVALSICYKSKEKDYGYLYMDFSEEKFFSNEQRDSLTFQMKLRQPEIQKIHQVNDTTCAGATDFEFAIEEILKTVPERHNRYGKSIVILAPITDGIETITHGKLDMLLESCRKMRIIITPVFIFDPLAMQGSQYLAYNDKGELVGLKPPSIIQRMAEETHGMYFWGLQDSHRDRVAFATTKLAIKIIRALGKENEIKVPQFSSGSPSYTNIFK